MGVAGYPTSSDIYLEAEGKKIAVVQSYKATSQNPHISFLYILAMLLSP